MKFFKRLFIFLLLLPALVSGNVLAVPNTVTLAQVTCTHAGTTVCRQYLQPHKIEAILNYLRLLKCKGDTSADPGCATDYRIEILLYDTAGGVGIYRQRANCMFSKNGARWKNIEPEQAAKLYSLIRSLPSDKKPQSRDPGSAAYILISFLRFAYCSFPSLLCAFPWMPER